MRDPTRGLPEVEVDGVVFRRGGRVVVRPGLDADLQARMLEGRTVTVERIYRDYDGRVHLGVSVDEPGQEIMRETGRFLWFFPPEVEVVRMKRILVAGDRQRLAQGRRLRRRGRQAPRGRASCPRAPPCSTSAPAGLDLAYEVMRGYDALVLVDVSRQGGEPGTLYVMEALEEEVEAGIEDGQVINPHGMDPQTVLRFVKTLGAWPGKVVVVACEPAEVEEMGIGLSDEVAARRRRRRRPRGRDDRGAAAPTPPTPSTEPCTSCRSPARS